MGFRPRAILRSVVVALVGIPAGLILWHNPNVQNNTLVLSTMYVPTNKEWLHRFIQYMQTVQYVPLLYAQPYYLDSTADTTATRG